MPPAFPFPQPQAPAQPSMHPMVCAWCHQQIGAGNPDLPVSHGICTKCAAKWRGESA